MKLEIFKKIEILEIIGLTSIIKVDYENASIKLSGGFLVITKHEITETISEIYSLSKIKSYKTIKK
jgi:hypothetical protein